jgi:two-component system response regulator RegA
MRGAERRIERVLVVEDDAALRAAVAEAARGWGHQVLEAGTASEAKQMLSPPPDLIIIDVRLPDEPAFAVLEAAARKWPVPIVVAMSGQASPEESFRLAQMGVRTYLAKPFTAEELGAAVETASRDTPLLGPVVTGFVGRVPLRELQDKVRDAMVRQALALAGGSRSGAARLLSISRQAVQQMLRGGLLQRGGAEEAGENPTDSKGD